MQEKTVRPPIVQLPNNNRFIDLTGRTFHHLKVLYYAGKKNTEHIWFCSCDCVSNTEKLVDGNSLKRGKVVSCGCHRKRESAKRKLTHGMSETSTYRIWQTMIARCSNENNCKYEYYGARGITVCQRWQESFENFYADMGARPSKDHSIERKENDGNYCPENCEWATHVEQCNNRRSNRLLTYNDKTLNVTQWAKELGTSPQILFRYLNKGLSLENFINKERESHAIR